jgi:hypothetical protein
MVPLISDFSWLADVISEHPKPTCWAKSLALLLVPLDGLITDFHGWQVLFHYWKARFVVAQYYKLPTNHSHNQDWVEGIISNSSAQRSVASSIRSTTLHRANSTFGDVELGSSDPLRLLFGVANPDVLRFGIPKKWQLILIHIYLYVNKKYVLLIQNICFVV